MTVRLMRKAVIIYLDSVVVTKLFGGLLKFVDRLLTPGTQTAVDEDQRGLALSDL